MNALEPVSVEHDGRVLSGVGVTPEELQQVMEDRTPVAAPDPDQPAADTTTQTPDPLQQFERNDDGTFRKNAKGRERFSTLTKERDEAASEAARLRAELDALRQSQHTAFPPANGNGNGHVAPEPAAPKTPEPTRPKPLLENIGTTYQTYEDFTEDLADWKAEQRFAQELPNIDARVRAGIEAEQASRALQQTLNGAVERGRKTYQDFDTVIAASSVVLPWPVLTLIAKHPHSEHLQYTLAKDAAQAQLIAQDYQRDPVSAGVLLERALGPSAAAASPASTARAGVTTNAPAPYQPVGSGAKTTVAPLEDLADHGDDYDTSGYRERRAAALRGGSNRR